MSLPKIHKISFRKSKGNIKSSETSSLKCISRTIQFLFMFSYQNSSNSSDFLYSEKGWVIWGSWGKSQISQALWVLLLNKIAECNITSSQLLQRCTKKMSLVLMICFGVEFSLFMVWLFYNCINYNSSQYSVSLEQQTIQWYWQMIAWYIWITNNSNTPWNDSEIKWIENATLHGHPQSFPLECQPWKKALLSDKSSAGLPLHPGEGSKQSASQTGMCGIHF